ncbi:MAG: protein translocase subunit SecF [Candidatus Marinimicrobia bacterium]|nr:protein translocase subunit SecF [Candidatus Neomarinimicrobiota bacterium]
MRLLKTTNINFLKYSRIAAIISLSFLTISVISVFFVRGLNYGIDFKGGVLVQVRFENPITTAEIRSIFSENNLGDAIIQKSNETNEFIIRLEKPQGSENIREKISEILSKIENNKFEIRKADQVGPKIGKELRKKALLAIISALFVIGVYITIRFQVRYAIGAVVALAHDVLFTLGIFSLTQLEISLSTVAAFLTIVGYSLNDTIVIYDRIRENIRLLKRETLPNVINKSLNDTLSRTIITSFTTFIAVFVLSFAPGEIKVFSIAMICGVMVGTYSSIYIASPVVIYFYNRFKAKKRK